MIWDAIESGLAHGLKQLINRHDELMEIQLAAEEPQGLPQSVEVGAEDVEDLEAYIIEAEEAIETSGDSLVDPSVPNILRELRY